MPYIIDGHNLIPKIPGLGLDEIDDEMMLVKLLQDYCRSKGKKAEVFFDNAQPGQMNHQVHHPITVHFVRSGITADQAIDRRLNKLERSARNYTIVSSDRQVQASARAKAASVIPSEEFAAMILREECAEYSISGEPGKPEVSEESLEEWMQIFSEGKNKSDEE